MNMFYDVNVVNIMNVVAGGCGEGGCDDGDDCSEWYTLLTH